MIDFAIHCLILEMLAPQNKVHNTHNIGFNGAANRFLATALSEQGQPELISRNLQ